MRILFTPAARAQYLAAVAYLAQDRPLAARRFHQRAARSLRRLERFPNSGRHIPEFPDLPHREVVLPPYRYFYRREGKTVWIVAVWHDAQLPEPPGMTGDV